VSWVLEFSVTVPGGLPFGIEDAIDRRLGAAGVAHDPVEVNAGPSLSVTFVAPPDAGDDAAAWGASLVQGALRAELGDGPLEVLLHSSSPVLDRG